MVNSNYLFPIYRKRLIKAYGNMCYYCYQNFSSKSIIEFHHIKETGLMGIGRGRKERYYDILNNPNSYVTLHKKCHKKIHQNNEKLILG